jgi:hemolysin D
MLMEKTEKPEKLKRQVYDFLPAALEIQETPPSPIGRLITWLIMLFFALAVAWGWYGHIDVVSVAQGKIIPTGKVKTIQPLEIGIVKRIHVKDGQLVKAGDPLITLDNTLIGAENNQYRQQLGIAQLQRTRQMAFQRMLDSPQLPENWEQRSIQLFKKHFSTVNPKDINIQGNLFIEQINESLYRRQALENELVKRKAEQDGAMVGVVKLQRTLPLITERTESMKTLMADGIISRHDYLKLRQEQIQQEQELQGFRAQFREHAAAIEEIRSQLRTIKAEAQKENLKELGETNQKIDALKQELVKVHQRDRQQVLKAPIDGTVEQLAMHTIGGVVTPAQELMRLVPKESTLEVEAYVLNKDIGFIEEGQEAEIKIDTFNFTKFGTIDGEIVDLSNDAISDEKLGLVYLCRVLMKDTQMQIADKLVNLSPGMSVSVEIKTGKRRLIEYFLSPLLKYAHESIRER